MQEELIWGRGDVEEGLEKVEGKGTLGWEVMYERRIQV